MLRSQRTATAIESCSITTRIVPNNTGNFAVQPPRNASPQEVISLALATEDYHARCYQEWAARFRPFDSGTVKLLESFAEEEEQHKQELLQFSIQLAQNPEAAKINQTVVKLQTHRRPAPQHFLVIDERMAAAIMQAALKLERDARRFYALCLSTSADRRLRSLCQRLGQLEKQQAEVLREFAERFCMTSPLDRRARY